MTYEYECKDCDQEFEVEQGIKEPPLDSCPRCGQKHVQRIIPKRVDHAGGFVLNGGRWARDGYSG